MLHGVQSHGGWYHNLGRTLAEAGYEAHFPDRRGSGANRIDRGHTPSMGRLLDDVAEFLASLKVGRARRPARPGGDLVGREARGDHGGPSAGSGRCSGADLPGACIPGSTSRGSIGCGSRWRYFIEPRKTFPIPLSDPRCSRQVMSARSSSPTIRSAFVRRRRAYSPPAASSIAWSGGSPPKVHQPSLLMLAGQGPNRR